MSPTTDDRGPLIESAGARNLILAHYDLGELDEAIAAGRVWLASDPERGDAVELLAGLYCDKKEFASAIAMLEPAIARQPANAALQLMLATARLGNGEVDAAAEAVQRAVALDPDRFRGESRFGMSMGSKGGAAAAGAMMAVAPIADTRVDEIISMVAHATSGMVGDVVKRNPKSERDLMALASGYLGSGHLGLASEIYGILLSLNPDNPIAGHMLAASSGTMTARASDGYVTGLFDSYAEGFDDSLARLQYRAPQLAVSLLASPSQSAARSLDILDAGCGTGLCGPLLRPYARRLSGVDLSSGMLARARERGVYDELVAAEITAHLEGCASRFDVVISADVLVYFGHLEPVLAGVARVLRSDGRFIFTVEHLADNAAGGAKLNPHGRYSHQEGYVRKALKAAGFADIEVQHAVLRMERGENVDGLVVGARKP